MERRQGWVKYYRQILDSPVFLVMSDRERNVMSTTLLLANWEPQPWFCRSLNVEVVIPPGAFVSSQADLARTCNTTRAVVRSAIARMTGAKFLRIQPLEMLLTAEQRLSPRGAPRGAPRVALYIVEKFCEFQGHNQSTTNPQPIWDRIPYIEEVKEIKEVQEECADKSAHPALSSTCMVLGTTTPEDRVKQPPDTDKPSAFGSSQSLGSKTPPKSIEPQSYGPIHAQGGEGGNGKSAKGNKPAPKPLVLTHPEAPRPRVAKRHMDAVVDAYVAAVESRLGFRPKLGDREYKHVRDLVLRHGTEHAVELAGAYPRLEDRWLHGKGFPLTSLMANANAVEVLLRGNGPKPKYDSTNVCTDPNSPGWDPDNF